MINPTSDGREEFKSTGNQEFDEYLENRKKLVEVEQNSYFTFDVGELSPQERIADQALQKLRAEVVQGDHSPLLLDFYEGKQVIENSRLMQTLELVPKGAHLHLHVEAGISIEEVVKFTTNDFVYYNVDKNLFKTAPNGLDEAGYIKCNKLRQEWTGPGTFDQYLESKLLLQPSEIDPRESRRIWDNFQYKFMLIDGVIHYHQFYKSALRTIARNAIKDGIRILEIRHASGVIFNDNCGKHYQETIDGRSGIACISADPEYLSLREEFELYQQVIQEIKAEEPNFELRVIVVSLKVLGREAVLKQLKSYQYAMDNGYTFVTGFDLVNEEDVTDPILNFVDDILQAKVGYPNFNLYLHAGESTSRFNENLYDAVLLKAKRIGHGVGINFHPKLTELVKSQNIGKLLVVKILGY